MTGKIDKEETISRLEKRLRREKSARNQAEKLLEEKSLELYALNQRLHEEARLLEATVINAKDGIIITDANLDNNGPKIIFSNTSFAKMTGYEKEELIGKTPRILQYKETDRKILNQMRTALEDGKPFQCQIKNRTKLGDAYWVDISVVPVKNNEGKVTNFAAIQRDITEQKAIQRLIKKEKQKAESANTMKSNFLANISHELRTPMNGIMGLTELVLESKISKENRESLETVYNSAETMLSLLNDLLDFSKIEAGQLEIDNVIFNLREEINIVEKLFLPIAKKEKLKLDFSIDKKNIFKATSAELNKYSII
jgi:PAS domain S-box-containing protein